MKHPAGVTGLVERMGSLGVTLPPSAAAALLAILHAVADEPQNLTAIRGVAAGVDRHLADSLVAATLPAVRDAHRAVDIGSGVGFPGLALAAAFPALDVTLVESEGRKGDWLRRASSPFPNVTVVADRSESYALTQRDGHDLVTARALGAMPVVLELAAPLLCIGGSLVAWRGDDDDPGTEVATDRAAEILGLVPAPPVPVVPFPGSRRRLQVFRKHTPTPARFPRRPGRAAQRPLGGRTNP